MDLMVCFVGGGHESDTVRIMDGARPTAVIHRGEGQVGGSTLSSRRSIAAEHDGQVRCVALLVGSDEAANDIVHDVLVAMLRRWDEISHPGSYLNRAVLNGCRDLGRRKHVDRNGAAGFEPTWPTVPTRCCSTSSNGCRSTSAPRS